MSAARHADLAELAIRVGVNLQRGQALVVRAPLDARELVLELTTRAYRLGAGPVTCLFEDPQALLAQLRYADDTTLDDAPEWLSDGVARAHEHGAARLDVLGPLPDLLDEVPIQRTIRLHQALAKAARRETELLERQQVNASALLFVTESWARRVFPDRDVQAAMSRLQDAVCAAAYADEPDGPAALERHLTELDARRRKLQQLGLIALRLHGDDMDLTVALAAGHRWVGGTSVAANGVRFAPSLIAEEVRVAVDYRKVNGGLVLARPLSIAGDVIERAVIEFRDGEIVSMTAESGLQALEGLLAADAGAGRIAAIGLAPGRTPATRFGTAFHNPVMDRATGCHLRFGQPDAACMTTGSGADVNESTIGVDAMLGTVDVDGLTARGRTLPLIRSGAFTL